MGARIAGLGGGNLPPNLVEQLVAAKRIPIQKMEASKGSIDAKLKLVDDLDSKVRGMTGKLNELFNTKGFTDLALKSGDPTIIDGVADPQVAKTGNWTVEVVSLPEKAGAMTSGFPDKDKSKVGVGYLKFDTEEGSQSVYINSSNNTLQGVAEAINGAGVGVHASVIKDSNEKEYPYKILISGNQSGKEGTVDFPTVYLLDGDEDFSFDTKREAVNGKVKVDGFEIEVSDSELKDIIPGVTLDLKKPDPGKPVRINITENQEVVEGKLNDFVGTINAVLGFVQSQNKMDEKTDTTKTLGGDSMLRGIESKLTRILQNRSFAGSDKAIQSLAQLGVEFNRNGTLDFKKDKFNAMLKSNPKAVMQFFRGDGSAGSGFIAQIKSFVDSTASGAYSPIASKRSGLQNQEKRIDQNIANRERMLAREEESMRRKFSNIEEQMSKMKAQGAALAGLGGGGG